MKLKPVLSLFMIACSTALYVLTSCSNITPDPIPVSGISVDPTSAIVGVGETLWLAATVTPSDATNPSVAWSTDDETVATVSTSGQVAGHAPGTATITVRAIDGDLTALSSISVWHSYIEATPTITALSNGITAAASSPDPSDPAYYTLVGMIFTYHFNDYVSNGITINGSLALDLTPPSTQNGTLTFTGGLVKQAQYTNQVVDIGRARRYRSCLALSCYAIC